MIAVRVGWDLEKEPGLLMTSELDTAFRNIVLYQGLTYIPCTNRSWVEHNLSQIPRTQPSLPFRHEVQANALKSYMLRRNHIQAALLQATTLTPPRNKH